MTTYPAHDIGSSSHPYAVGVLDGMLRVDSPSYHEGEVASHIVALMRDLGFTAEIDAAGNAVGTIGRGGAPSVMLLGHMDTIPGHIPVRVEGDRLYGRGAVDAKGPLAAMICAAATAAARGFPGSLTVVGAVEEETPSSRGAMHIRATHPRPDALIVGEPSGWDTVVVGYKGKTDLSYRVRCDPTHPSNPEPKATELVCRAWGTLLDVLGPGAGNHSFATPGPTLVSLSGDMAVAEAEFSVRTPPLYDVERLVDQLTAKLPKGHLELINSVAACRTDRSDPVVRALSGAIRAQHHRPVWKVKSGTSDMNTLAEVWDVPMATYGPGDSALDHADNEHILMEDYLRGIDVLVRTLDTLGADPALRPALSLLTAERSSGPSGPDSP
ncbi:M20/M25/M40 family metallo-hydrolase [Streptomyces sp. G44]|uniref:M20/M25/M40 family metallo-hydrolase n=1 Tax=Streptomyces sp. G44 TaxID=2807632 RepID=UPI0019620615|nr:M20/M25/M40 family metallo-hydrolase [Streptomyces sp. G44]MBM7172715.1 M20/M25/M40 family metallo-hydrolase [Streptomyces sp. G44]